MAKSPDGTLKVASGLKKQVMEHVIIRLRTRNTVVHKCHIFFKFWKMVKSPVGMYSDGTLKVTSTTKTLP